MSFAHPRPHVRVCVLLAINDFQLSAVRGLESFNILTASTVLQLHTHPDIKFERNRAVIDDSTCFARFAR